MSRRLKDTAHLRSFAGQISSPLAAVLFCGHQGYNTVWQAGFAESADGFFGGDLLFVPSSGGTQVCAASPCAVRTSAAPELAQSGVPYVVGGRRPCFSLAVPSCFSSAPRLSAKAWRAGPPRDSLSSRAARLPSLHCNSPHHRGGCFGEYERASAVSCATCIPFSCAYAGSASDGRKIVPPFEPQCFSSSPCDRLVTARVTGSVLRSL